VPESEFTIRKLLKRIVEIEMRTDSGKMNYAFGLLMGVLFILSFVATLVETLGKFVLQFFGKGDRWDPWVPLVGMLLCILYFLACVLLVSQLERRKP
jgi:phosphotransferase system  glucose/maltose/N-acetylglucosamine-specific IIC component